MNAGLFVQQLRLGFEECSEFGLKRFTGHGVVLQEFIDSFFAGDEGRIEFLGHDDIE